MSHSDSTSDLLLNLRSRLDGRSQSVETILSALSDRGIAAALLVVTLPQLLPIPLGISNLLALPVVAVAAQMALGRDAPWLPARLRRQSIRDVHIKKACLRLEAAFRRMERFVRPRLPGLFARRGYRLVGFACLVISLVSLAPLPLTGWLPGWALAIIGIGMLERDGIFVLAGMTLGVVALTVFALVLLGLGEAVELALPAFGTPS